MVYDGCFYDLNCCAITDGIACWTKDGRLFRYRAAADVNPRVRAPPGAWEELKLDGKIPGSSVDFSVMVHDAKRDRLILMRTDYGKEYDGEIHAVDLKTMAAARLSPPNAGGAARAGKFGIDRACYCPGADLVLLGTLLPAGPDSSRRTPAYDPAGNRWVSLRLGYETGGDAKEPLTPRGHSSGIVHDPKRGLIWGVDASCEVYVLRLEPAGADVRPME
jgi:hypothetical protein